MRRPILAVFLLGAAAAALATAASAETHPFTVQDLVALQRISEPQPSPRGDQVVFVLRTSDLAANRGRTDLWKVNVDGSGLVQLTSHEASESSPRWSPDGRAVYFLTSRSGSSQVWRLPAGGGEPEQVTDLPLDVGSFALSPDGSRLAVSLEVFTDCPDLACTRKRLDDKEKSKVAATAYDQVFVRHWDTWSDGRRSHLFVVPAAPAPRGQTGAAPVDLTRGMPADVPSKPFGGAEEYAFSPDGKSVVFSARIAGENNREEPWSTNFDLYMAPADGSRPPRNLTAANPAWDTQPVFSPDGKTLAYLAMARAGFEADRYRVVLMSLPEGRTRVLTEGWDRSPEGLLFSADGKTLYATAGQVQQVPLFAIDAATGKVRELVAKGSVHSPGLAGDRLVFGLDTLTSPAELYTVRADGTDLKAITAVNRERMAAVRLGEPEYFEYPGAGGDTVHGYVVKPVDFDPAKRYPVAFLIHGGPQGSFHNEFHYRWNPQTYAGHGYAVVTVDFHGSTGYGQAFTDAIRGDWGGKPLEDLKKGLAAALERNPWMDGDRVCALGASYGGYMTNWVAGNWPDRFRCLVTHDGIFDQRMMYYATEELWFPEWEQGGPYWQNPQGHERDSPANFVTRWKTPMLIVHGGLDYRIPVTQGLAAFNTLQRRGIPSRFLYFPDENHWVLKPANSVLWHETVLDWLDRWLQPAGGGR